MKKSASYIELAARIHVFILLNLYGTGKILGGQFYRKGELPPEIAQLTLADAGAYELAWTFMGYSFAYILFVGLSQIVGAWLLLWERTKFLGIAILIPIMVNIVVFDILFLDLYDALVSAVLYLFLLFLILWLNREKTYQIWQAMTTKYFVEPIAKPQFKRVLIAFVLFIVLFGVEQFFVSLVRGHA